MNVISLLTKSELFAGVDSATLERLGESATEHRLRRGDKLFEEDDAANDLYIVTSGRIAIANKSIDGRESMVALMESGDLFGEMPLFDALGRPALHHHQPQTARDPRSLKLRVQPVDGTGPGVRRVLRVVHGATRVMDECVIRAVVTHDGDSRGLEFVHRGGRGPRVGCADDCQYTSRVAATYGVEWITLSRAAPFVGYVDHPVERHVAVKATGLHRLECVHAAHAEPDDVDAIAARHPGGP